MFIFSKSDVSKLNRLGRTSLLDFVLRGLLWNVSDSLKCFQACF